MEITGSRTSRPRRGRIRIQFSEGFTVSEAPAGPMRGVGLEFNGERLDSDEITDLHSELGDWLREQGR